jgi:hypothetical protein
MGYTTVVAAMVLFAEDKSVAGGALNGALKGAIVGAIAGPIIWGITKLWKRVMPKNRDDSSPPKNE